MILLLIDIGVNFIDKFFVEDLEQVIELVVVSGVMILLIIGINLLELQQVVQFCCRFLDVIFSIVGVYFYYVKEWILQYVVQLISLVVDCKVVVIGEIGLDYNCNFFVLEQQCKVFESQLELVVELKMLLFLYE